MNKLFIILGLVLTLNLAAQDSAPKPQRQERKGPKIEQKCDCKCHKDPKKHPSQHKEKRPAGPLPHKGPKPDKSIR
jgi:hypothetical protein